MDLELISRTLHSAISPVRLRRELSRFLCAFFAAFLLAAPALPLDPKELLAIVGATVYAAPTVPPMTNSVVLVKNGKIAKIGERGRLRIPGDVPTIDAAGLILVPGFWNCHVHFAGPQWQDAAHQPPEKLTGAMQQMLTRYGFTTVFDTGSVLENTTALRHRVESGEVFGPRIFTTGEPLFPKGGIPIYIKTVISPDLYSYLQRTAEVEGPDQATADVDKRVDGGADAIKIFTGSWLGGDQTVEMPLPIVKAAVEETHREGKLAFAHPQTLAGVENALDGGVDILAHTAPSSGIWDAALLARMKLANIALIPTLTLWQFEARREKSTPVMEQNFIQGGVDQLRAFVGNGGRVMFGTDVGYTDLYDTAEEFELMSKAGMTFQDILISLTTAPVARLGDIVHQGRIAPGFDADLVLLKGDPAVDVKNFAHVAYTIRAGKIIFKSP